MLEMMEARVGGVSGLAHCQTLPAKGDGGIRLHFWMFVSQLPVFVVNSHKLLLSIKLDPRAAVRSTYIPFELSVDIRAPLIPSLKHYIMARHKLETGPLTLLLLSWSGSFSLLGMHSMKPHFPLVGFGTGTV